MITIARPLTLGVRLSSEEYKALNLVADAEGVPMSIILRRALRLALREAAPHISLPTKILTALQAQQLP